MKPFKNRLRDRHRECIRKRKNRGAHEVEVVERKETVGIGLLNMQGKSRTGMEDVRRAVADKDLDFMCLVETHVRKEDRRGPSIEGFETHQACREGQDKKGGGLAILARKRKGIAFTRYKPNIKSEGLGYVNKERLWLTYQSQGGKTAIGCVYLGCQSSDGRHDRHNAGIYEVLADEIYTLRGKGFRVLLQGDFNSWVGSNLEQGGIPGNRHKTNSNGVAFKEFLYNNNMVHVNGACRVTGDWSTRISEGLWTRHGPDYTSSSVLDYVVVSSEHLDSVKEMTVDEKGALGGGSDHNMVTARVKDKFVCASQVPRCGANRPGWDIDEDQDWTEYKKVVEQEMQRLQDDGTRNNFSVDLLEHSITKAITKGLEEGVGRRRERNPDSQRVLPKHIVKTMKERRMLEKEWKTEKCKFAASWSQTPPNSLVVAAQRLKDKETEVEEKIRVFERQNRAPIKKLCKQKSKRGRQMFWKYVSRKHHKLEDVTALQNKRTGVLRFKPEEVSEEIFGYLKEIFSGTEGPAEPTVESVSKDHVHLDHNYAKSLPEGSTVPGHEYASAARPHLTTTDRSGTAGNDPGGYLDKDFTELEVKETIKALGNEKATGHDFVPNEALKNAPPVLIEKLVVLFNRVKNKGEAPNPWKRGRLVLIHKKGSRTDTFNYRPLTVLTAVSGLYTKLLNNRLAEVVEAHGLLGEIQNGFRKTRSGGECAFVLNTILWKSAAQRKDVHLAFLDLMKAYDSVDRPTLWRKLGEMGFGGKFLRTIQKLYDGDHVTCKMNGVTTPPVYLGRGLRQGCSLSPLLFALYVAGLGQDLTLAKQGVKLYRVCVSGIFFADDIVLVARSAEGLRQLLVMVESHCRDLKMKLAVNKCKVMSKSSDTFEMVVDDEVAGCLDKVMRFRYLGLECELSPARTARAMQERAITVARKYKACCLRVARDGPDTAEVAMALWTCIAKPSLKFGCEAVPMSTTAMDEVTRQQVSMSKAVLGLPQCAPNISGDVLLGTKPFRDDLYAMQLKFYVRLQQQADRRWSKDALLDHLRGSWASPYIKHILGVKKEVGMVQGPVSARHVDIVVNHYTLRKLNDKIFSLSLPALKRVSKLAVASHVDESEESQVSLAILRDYWKARIGECLVLLHC